MIDDAKCQCNVVFKISAKAKAAERDVIIVSFLAMNVTKVTKVTKVTTAVVN